MRIKSACLRGLLAGFLLVLFLPNPASADEIELDGRTFTGEITQGFPNTITIIADGVTAHIDRQFISSISFETPPRVETTTGHTFQGQIASTLSEIITIQTDAGPVDVQLANIRAIRFPYPSVSPPSFNTRVFLDDGRKFNGNLETGIPDPVDIKEKEFVAHVALSKINEISYGETDIIRTVDNQSYEGEIVSRLPTSLSLKTAYGSLEIAQEKITLIRFLHRQDQNNNNNNGGLCSNPLVCIAIAGFALALLLWFLR